jgi:hypothetical protein
MMGDWAPQVGGRIRVSNASVDSKCLDMIGDILTITGLAHVPSFDVEGKPTTMIEGF